MSSTPTPPQNIDPIAEFLNTVISGLTTGVGAPAIEKLAEGQAPFLALPIVRQLFEAMIGYLAGKISVMEQQGVLTLVFAIEEDSKLYGLGQAALALQKAKQSGDADAISKATQDAIDRWAGIIHFGGIAPVKP